MNFRKENLLVDRKYGKHHLYTMGQYDDCCVIWAHDLRVRGGDASPSLVVGTFRSRELADARMQQLS